MDERTMTLAAQTFQEEPQLLQKAEDSQEFAKLQSSARRVTLDRGVGRYVVEGDLLYDDDELRLYALQRETRAKARQLGLGPITPSGRSDALVVVSPKRSHWAATCGVVFEHAEEFDEHADVAASPDEIDSNLVFTVRGIDAQGQFIAAAFFPTYPPQRRRVLIDPSYFAGNLSFDPVGVLRHELGHVLGFRWPLGRCAGRWMRLARTTRRCPRWPATWAWTATPRGMRSRPRPPPGSTTRPAAGVRTLGDEHMWRHGIEHPTERQLSRINTG